MNSNTCPGRLRYALSSRMSIFAKLQIDQKTGSVLISPSKVSSHKENSIDFVNTNNFLHDSVNPCNHEIISLSVFCL